MYNITVYQRNKSYPRVYLPTLVPGNLTTASMERVVMEEVKAAVKMEIMHIPSKIHSTANRRPATDFG